jgi:hypothetical protein
VNRSDLHRLARIRIREARVLKSSRLYDGAYHLAGLAVECALKACIARNVRRHDFPDKDFASEVYSHDLKRLVRAAGLQAALDNELTANASFNRNWAVVKDWAVDSRYSVIGRLKANDFYSALTARQNGVMRWIRQRW